MATATVFRVDKPDPSPSNVVFKAEAISLPTLGDHDVLVKISCCGVCHTDFLHLRAGRVPGHEMIGHVIARGSGVSGVDVGMRVGVGWQLTSCLECRLCFTGHEQLCSKRKTFGDTLGGYASHVVWDSRFVIPVPDELSDVAAAPLMCAGSTVYSAFANNNLKPGCVVGVVGIGGLGHLALQIARAWGCRVVALTRSADKAAEIKAMGATDIVVTTDADSMAKYNSKLDFLLSTVPGTVDWSLYFPLMAPLGTVCFVGVPDKPLSMPGGPFLGKELKFCGSLVGSRASIRDMLQFCALHQIRPYTETLPLTEAGIQEALRRVDTNQVRFRAVLVPE